MKNVVIDGIINIAITFFKGGFVMGFWQVTLGDVIGYVLTVASTAITVSVVIKVKYSSHHNTKKNTKVNQSSSVVGRDQIGGDKR